MKIACVFPRTRYPSGQPPLGILSLAAYLRERVPGVTIEVIDTTFAPRPLEMIRTRIEGGDYDLVGLSVTFPSQAIPAPSIPIVRCLRRRRQGIDGPGIARLGRDPQPLLRVEFDAIGLGGGN